MIDSEIEGSYEMKRTIHDLAAFGASPTFAETLHVGHPNIGSRESFNKRMEDILDRGWLTNNGQYVQEFERKVADLLGVRNCVAMCNGTVALEIAVRALGMKDEVIVPSFTFVATAHCLQWQEITPVFCDIMPDSYVMDPEAIERLITPRTSGIVGVHCFGVPCDTEAIQEVAQRHGLPVLYDAAHAFGVTNKGTSIGNFGDAEVMSFHATKFVNAFEGGAVVTNDDELAKKMRLMKNFGFEGMDSVIYLGINGKMNEACAAMGLTSIESMSEFREVNRDNYHAYQEGLSDIPGCSMLSFDENEENNFQYITLCVDEEQFGLSRDELMQILHAENVRARRYFYPGAHRTEPYRTYYPNAGLLLTNSEAAAATVLCLPTGTAIDTESVKQICSLIQYVAENATSIHQRLESSH